MILTDELKAQIDGMTYAQMLRKNRFAPIGDPLFMSDSGRYFLKVMSEKKMDDPAAAIAASKRIGWTP